MFTGIIRGLGKIVAILNSAHCGMMTLILKLHFTESKINQISIGDSICVNGICLTVCQRKNDIVLFDVIEETRTITTIKNWKVGQMVNCELSVESQELKMDGYIVTGHIDAKCKILDIKNLDDNSKEYIFQHPDSISSQIVYKGTIIIDGVCLTISKVDRLRFSVSIIPHTLSQTIFQYYKRADECNVETDIRLKNAKLNHKDIIFPDIQVHQPLKIAIISTVWNSIYVSSLKEQAINVFKSYGNIIIEEIIVPGAFEIPGTIICASRSLQYDAILAIGILIKGETKHFEYLSQSVFHGLIKCQMEISIPVINGVLTCLNERQVQERVNGQMASNWAKSTLLMISNYLQLQNS